MPWVDVGGTDVQSPPRPWAEHLHALVPYSRYQVIDRAAHSAHFEQFDAYLRCVQVFLSEQGL